MTRIVECVPNFSEGKDKSVIEAIAGAIKAVEGVKLLQNLFLKLLFNQLKLVSP